MVDKPKKKTVFECFLLKLTKLTFKSCHGNLDNELRPCLCRREKNPSLFGGELWRVTILGRLRKPQPRGWSQRSGSEPQAEAINAEWNDSHPGVLLQ